MAENMSYKEKAEEITNILLCENNLNFDDIVTAVIGLSRIVTIEGEKNKKLSVEVDHLKKRIHELKRGV